MIESEAILIDKEISSNGKSVFLTLHSNIKFHFLEGQFIMIDCLLSTGMRKKKPYSIATTYKLMHTSQQLGLYVKQEGIGGCSEYLTQDFKIGENVIVKGPVGHYVDTVTYKNYLFISTGSGLAPNRAILQQLQESKSYDKIAFLFGERDEHFMLPSILQSFNNLAEIDSDKHYFKLCYSQQKGVVEYHFQPEYVQMQIPGALAFLGPREQISVFLCGNPQMVDQCVAILLASGISRSQITIEKY